jgi:hypothetical protein
MPNRKGSIKTWEKLIDKFLEWSFQRKANKLFLKSQKIKSE